MVTSPRAFPYKQGKKEGTQQSDTVGWGEHQVEVTVDHGG